VLLFFVVVGFLILLLLLLFYDDSIIERDSFSLQKVYTHVLKVVKSTKSSRRRRDAFLFFIREKNLLARLSLCATAEIVSDSSVDLTAKDTFVQCRKGAQTKMLA